MLKSVNNSECVLKNNLLYRASLRGLKKCKSCGFINGQRAILCRNLKCKLRVKRLAAIKPFDPIQIVTVGNIKLYSLRSKEKLLQPRSFVRMTEFLGPQKSQPKVVCYVDNCKYDALEQTHLVCRHIKACEGLTNVSQAEVYSIDKSILWNLNIPAERKQHLWNLYQLEEKLIPPVQKINSTIFVVKCVESKNFPAGRLHVTVFGKKIPNKSGFFCCSCKKHNLIKMNTEICDHLMLLLAAILNKPEGKILYDKFLDMLQYLWMPTSLNPPLVNGDTQSSQFVDYDLSLEKYNKPDVIRENVEDSDNTNDIFNFSEELYSENNIPDFSDIILEANNEMISKTPNTRKLEQTEESDRFVKDPKLNVTTPYKNDEDMELNFLNLNPEESLTSSSVGITHNPADFNHKGLSDIEQFQLKHNVPALNDSLELAGDIESLKTLEFKEKELNAIVTPCTLKQESLLKIFSNRNITEEPTRKVCKIIKSANVPATPLTVQKSIVLKQVPVKMIKLPTSSINKLPMEQNTSNRIVKISEINPKNATEFKSNQNVESVEQIPNNCNGIQFADTLAGCMKNSETNSITSPSMSYESWLDHIIEVLNESVSIQDLPSIKINFHVPDTIFNYFSKTFNLNKREKLSCNNAANYVKSRTCKNVIKYTWHFDEASTVQRIFTSQNLKIELERLYQRLADGSYELYAPATVKLTDDQNLRLIYPKIQLYKVFIEFKKNSELRTNDTLPHNCGLKLEWLPSALPKSNFGLMTIEFCLSVKDSVGIA